MERGNVMTTVEGNVVTIRIGGKGENVTLPSLIDVLSDTLEILREIDARLSADGNNTLRWEILKATTNSPLTMTIAGLPVREDLFNPDVGAKYTSAFAQLQAGVEPPAYFSPKAIQKAKELVASTANGVGTITYSTQGQEAVEVSEEIGKNAEAILKRTFYRTHSTLTGRLETLDVHEKYSFIIYDTLTGDGVRCIFDAEMYPLVEKAIRKRVAVSGSTKYNRRTGRAVSIRVESVRILRSAGELPQFRKGEYINITGDVDPAKYIRSVRDAE
jgi:hypothetical protein